MEKSVFAYGMHNSNGDLENLLAQIRSERYENRAEQKIC